MDGQDQCLNNNKSLTQNSSQRHMVDFGIAKWHHHKSLEFDDMDFFSIFTIIILILLLFKTCGK